MNKHVLFVRVISTSPLTQEYMSIPIPVHGGIPLFNPAHRVVQDNTSPRHTFLLTRAQVRAGRVLAGLGVRALAKDADLSPTAISQLETGRTEHAHESTLKKLRDTLENHGIEFRSGGWLRRRDDTNARRLRSATITLPQTIGRNCKAARSALSMSPDDVAEAMGEAVEVYTRIEQGSANISARTLLSLSRVFSVSTDFLLLSVPRSQPDADPVTVFQRSVERRQLEHMLKTASQSQLRLIIAVLKELGVLEDEPVS